MRSQQAVAEAVDGRDPRPVERTREIVASGLDEPRPDASAQLARRLLGIRDHEHRLDVEAFVAHGPGEALGEHPGLARPRAGGDEDVPARLDRGLLFGVQRHARLIRHIGQRSHHVGQAPPRGS